MSKAEYGSLALGTVFIVPEGTKRQKIPETVPIGKLGCGYSFSTACRSEIVASRATKFSYGAAIVSRLALTSLVSSVVALMGYFSIVVISWIVRGFMRS
jgi:hypothetical protein